MTSSPSGLTIDTQPADEETQGEIRFLQWGGGYNYAWNRHHDVSVTADHDNDTDDETFTITLTGNGSDYNGWTATVTVNVTDDDRQEFILSTDAVDITEGGGTGTFTVKLNAAPTTSATISVSSGDTGAVTVSPEELTFSSANHLTAQTVTVTPVADSDGLDESVTITVSATSGYSDAPNVTKTINVTDDDRSIDLSAGTLSVTEGSTGTFDVTLETAPATGTDAILSVTSGDTTLATVSPSPLTFTSSNYNTAQTVTVTPVQDSDGLDESVTVTVSVTSGYDDADDVTNTVSIVDDDRSIELSTTTLSLAEGGSAGTFDVTLETPPAAGDSATFSVTASGDTGAVTVSETSLTFTASNYDTAQTVTVTPQDDNDRTEESVTITLANTADYDADDVTVSVSVTDDDSIIASASAISLTEGDSAGESFTVKLSRAPTSNTTVDIATSGNTDAVTLSKTALTFTASNYDTAQPVTVAPVDDADADNENITLTLSISGGYIASDETISISVVDDEKKSIDVSSLKIDLEESDTAGKSFTVKLEEAPTSSSTTVSISNPDTDAITVSPTTLTFTSANYGTPQSVTVSPVDDTDPVSESVTITVSAGSTYHTYDVKVTVADSDAPPVGTIVLDGPDTLRLVEGQNSLSFNVKIDGFTPIDPNWDWDILVSVTNADPGAISVSPATLTFNSSNIALPQSVSVVAVEDDDSLHESVSLVVSANGMSALRVGKQVLVQDDDIPAGTIILDSTDPLEIAAGGVGHFTVRLSGQPNENVTLALSASDDAITLDPTRLTFTPSDWIEAKRVKVSAGPLAGSGNEIYAITLSADGGIDTDDVQKTVRAIYTPPPDAKTIVVTLLPTDGERLRIDEDSSGRFTVGLEYHDEPPPTENVVVRLINANPDISLSPDLLTFTPAPLANPSTAWAVWNETITVQVDARSDVDTQNDSDTISLTSDGFIERKLHIDIKDTTGNDWPMKAWALALPPPTVQDDATLRVHCRQDTPCYVYLDCGAQRDDSTYEGAIPDPIPARGSRVFTAQDIARHTGGLSWEGQGRLGCALRSPNAISAQVWTRSGDGVLVNNSAMIRSYPEGERHRADIESISSPDSQDKANIRIHCIAPVGDCTDTRLDCYDDYGTMYGVELGRIRRQIVHHLQSEELAMRILHRWNDLGLSCEVRSDNPFTVQVLSRTGGGGALVNNSASGN